MIDEKIVTPCTVPDKRSAIQPLDIFWTAGGFLLEFQSPVFSPAPSGAALAAALSGRRGICTVIGAVIGAVFHGFPTAFTGIIAAALVFAVRLVPEFHSLRARALLRCASSFLAIFLSRLTDVAGATQLLKVILSALTAGLFTLCVYLLSENIRCKGFDITDTNDCALASIVTALAFASLGQIDFAAMNIGAVLLGAASLLLSASGNTAAFAAVCVSGILGLSAASSDIAAEGAVLSFSAAASVFLARRHRAVRAVGYVFISVTAALVTGVDEGSWKLLVQAAISAAAFAVIPVGKLWSPNKDCTGSSATLMLCERLNFAADAISSIEAGLQAAAETLDKKYKSGIENIAERAADRCCRSCPNSMICWGKNYDLFYGEFSGLVEAMRSGSAEVALSAECSDICVDPDGVKRAVQAEYARFVSVKQSERRIRELRRIYTDQLEGVRDILRDMGSAKSVLKNEGRYQAAERRAEKVLINSGMESAQVFVKSDNHGKILLEAYAASEPKVTCDYLGVLLSRCLGRELSEPQISGGGRYKLTAAERTNYSVKVGAFQIPRGQNQVCGDCYEYFISNEGELYVILSDGMGSGSRARVDSAMACSVLSKLLKCGISMKTALEIVNTVLMVKSSDESFATLDICKIDLNSGEGAVYKAGAATTYIRLKDKLVRASLSSAPVGTGGKLSVPAQKFTIAGGDVVVMLTDGVAVDEEWLSRELSGRIEPNELSEHIARAARMDKSKDDDISVITLALE